MTLDEAIKHCEEVISQCKEGTTCALEHKQLRDWLTKLKSYEEIKEKKGMKPFDLEKAKSGKPVRTRDGKEARILCFDLKDEDYPIIVAISIGDREIVECYTIDGRRFNDSSATSDKDLMMVCEVKEGWVNIYEKGIQSIEGVAGCSHQVYRTKEEAIKGRCEIGYIDSVKIKWEE